MSAQPARRPPQSRRPAPSRQPSPSRQPPRSRRPAPTPRDRAARLKERRRRRHLQQLRRDALTDLAIALALMIFLVIVTAGLGVIALLELPLAAIVIGSFALERRRARNGAISAAKRPRRRQ